MKRTPQTSSRNRYQAASDLTIQNQQMFENAGNDIEPIELEDPYDEIESLKKLIDQNAEWDDQVAGMKRLMGLINGGALDNYQFRHDLPVFYSGCSAAVRNLRSALVKQACLLICQLARELDSSFDQLGDFISPLSTQLSHGTQIIADSCKFAILCIAKNCPSRRILTSIIDLAGKKGSCPRSVAAESFLEIVSNWNLESYNSLWPKIESCIIQLCSDASPETRSFARDTILALSEKDPKKSVNIINQLDPRTRRAFDELAINVNNNDSDDEFHRKPIKKPSRAPSPRIQTRKLKPTPSEKRNPSPAPQLALKQKQEFEEQEEIGLKREKFNQRENDNDNETNEGYKRPSNIPTRVKPQIKQRPSNLNKKNYNINFDYGNNDNFDNDNEVTNDNRPYLSSRASQASSNTARPQSKQSNRINPSSSSSARSGTSFKSAAHSRAPSVQPSATSTRTKQNSSRVNRAPSASKVETQIETKRKQQYRNETFPSRGAVGADNCDDELFNNRISETPNQRKDTSASRRQSLAPMKPFSSRGNNNANDAINTRGTQKKTNSGSVASSSTSKNTTKMHLQSGQERIFLAGIRRLIEEGETAELSENLTDVSLGILKCCVHSSPQIQAAGFSVLNDFLPAFHDHFKPSLKKLLALLNHAVESSAARTAATAQSIINDLPKYFECNELIKVALQQPATFPVLHLLSSLVSMSEASLTNDTICMQLLQFAFTFHKNIDMKIRHTTAHIIMRVEQKNHSVIKKFCSTLSESNRESFNDFISPYLPNVSYTNTNIDVPRFDPKLTISFRHKIVEIIENANENEWNEVRGQVYSELNEAMQSKGQESAILNIVKGVLQERGVEEFHRLLPGLLFLSKSGFSPLVNNIFVILMKGTDISQFVSAIIQEAQNSEQSLSASIDLITRVYATVKPKDCIQSFQVVFPLLKKEFTNENAEIRKKVVMCLVEMKVADSETADKYINTLLKSQQKLVAVYYNRRITQ